jgi:hypothetical protein
MVRARVVVTVLGLLAPAAPAAADRGDRWDAATMAEQAGGGAVGMILGGASLGTVGLLVAGAGSQGNWGVPLAGGALGVLVGGAVGEVWGVQYVGDGARGSGRWWGTSVGAVAGLAGAGGVAVLASRYPGGSPTWTIAVGVGLVLAGPIVGYQLTADAHAATTTTAPTPRALIVPLVGGAF